MRGAYRLRESPGKSPALVLERGAIDRNRQEFEIDPLAMAVGVRARSTEGQYNVMMTPISVSNAWNEFHL
jgi:hypothetical protein